MVINFHICKNPIMWIKLISENLIEMLLIKDFETYLINEFRKERNWPSLLMGFISIIKRVSKLIFFFFFFPNKLKKS